MKLTSVKKLFLLLLLFISTISMAQDFAEDPFEFDHDIGVVGRKNFDSVGRFDFTLYGGINAFNVLQQDMMLGGGIRYSFLDWLGLEAVYYYHIFDMSTLAAQAELTAAAANRGQFYIDFISSEFLGHLVFVPIYGKHHIAGAMFVNYELFLFLGGGVMTVEQQVVVANPNSITFGGDIGGGFRFHMNELISIVVEVRNLVHRDLSFGDSQLSNNFSIQMGLGFTLPTFDKPKRKI